MNAQAAFVCLLLLGIVALVAGLVLTRLHWRSDLEPFGRGTRYLPLLLHPDRYVRAAPLRSIRALNLAGVLLIVGAIGVLVAELLRPAIGR